MVIYSADNKRIFENARFVLEDIAQMKAGDTIVVIADRECYTNARALCDTARALGAKVNPRVQEQLPARMEAIIKGVAEGMGGTYQFEYVKGFIPTVNTPVEFALVRNTAQTLLGHDCVIIPDKSTMTGEDFSFFLKEIPGVFYWLGCQKPNAPFYPLHNNRFEPDEADMKTGMGVMISSVLAYLSN